MEKEVLARNGYKWIVENLHHLKLLNSMLNTKNTMLFSFNAFLFRMGLRKKRIEINHKHELYIVDFE